MRNPTDMMRQILTSPSAQKMIDYVSPVYGNSYVGLWLFQAIGTILDPVAGYAETLRTEANPITSVLLLDLWEQQYNLPADSRLTTAQRQARLASKLRSRGPCNPSRLAAAISSALGGAEVDVEENVDKNTFLVNIREVIDDITPAVAIIEQMKPAHLIYQIRVATQTVSEADIKIAIAMTQAERYRVEVMQ